jgi:hypothetical protein
MNSKRFKSFKHNGDGMEDIGVYRLSILKSILTNGTERTGVPWGLGTDKPVTGKWS